MLAGQISYWQLSIDIEEHGKLPLKFGQNRMSNNWDIAGIELLVVEVGVGGVKSFNLSYVRLSCGWVVFHQRLSSTEGRLPLKVVFHRWVSSTEGRLPPKFVFHQRSSSNKGYLPPKVVFHQRPSSIEGHLPSKVIFHHHNTLVDLIFVRTVNIQNLKPPTLLRSGLNFFLTNERNETNEQSHILRQHAA